MKRPFAVLCVLFAALSVVRSAADRPDRDGPLRETVTLLRQEAGEDGELTLAGTVKECSAVSSGLRLSVNHLTIQRKDKSEQSLFSNMNVTVTTDRMELLPGDRIVVSGKAAFWEPASNPGQFDAQEYYDFRNTVCAIRGAAIREVVPGRMCPARALGIVRRRLRMSYEAILEEHQARTMEAVCLGERGQLEQEWKQLYQEGGISHILAISGLHISLVGMCLYRLLRRLGGSFGVSCTASGAAVTLYVLMTGAGVSAVRALLMFGLWLGAQLWGRKYDMTTAIAMAAMLLLFRNAGNLSQASFLLSFGAVLSIALLLPCLRESFPGPDHARSRRNVPEKGGHTRCLNMPAAARTLCKAWTGCFTGVTGILLPAAGLWLGTLPLTLYFFYQAVPWSILLNLAVVPLMSVLMVYGLLAGVIGLLSVPLGVFFAAPAYYILELFDFLCRIKEGLPAPVWVLGRPALWRILLFYGILSAAGMLSCRLAKSRKTGAGKRRGAGAVRNSAKAGRMRRRKAGQRGGQPDGGWITGTFCRCLLWSVCAVTCVGLMCVRTQERLAVTCLDVGQGDGALLRLPGGVVCLVDGGSTSESDVWRYRISQTVKYYGVKTLDYVFLSHADEDHVSGIEEYLREYEPGFAGENIHGVTLRNLVLPPTLDAGDFRELIGLAADKGIQVLRMEAGGIVGNAEERVSSVTGNAEEGVSSVTDSAEEERAAVPVSGGNLWSITCLAPDSERLTGDRNEDSMVLMLQYGTFRMLFTGDLEGNVERRLAVSGADLSADVLKVGHHGSGNGSSEEFLEQVSPEIAVISCGADNPYGHPAQETVERLQDTGSRIVETSQSGAVTIVSDGRTYSVETWL